MPLLPRKNSLDYNPDATIAASKKLTAIALERMKNPLEDPDFATASTLAVAKSLGDTFDRFEGLAGRYSSLVARLGNLLGVGIRQRVFEREMEEDAEMLYGNGRKKGGALSSARIEDYNRRLQADRGRFRQFYEDDDRNSVATPSVFHSIATPSSISLGESDYPYDDPNEPSIDDEDGPNVPTERSFRPRGGPRIMRGEREDEVVAERAGANFNSLIYPLIQITREMNLLINSRIRPAISKLTTSQIDKMNKIYQMVRTSYNDAIFPITKREKRDDRLLRQAEDDIENVIIGANQFGDEVLSVWNEERKNLLLNLTIVINSWKQNTPTGQQYQFSNDITREFQATASRLGKKGQMADDGYGETIIPLPQGDDPEVVSSDAIGDIRVEEGISGLRQYDKRGRVIPFDGDAESVGAGRKLRGRPRKKDTMTMTMVGNGRNFYGEEINNSRDIPTIWRSYRDCPTKYML